MFGSAAQTAIEKASSLPALQELFNHQEPAAHQAETGKKAGHRFRVEKIKIDTVETQGPDHGGAAAMRHREAGPRSRKKTLYELRDQELKTEESKLDRRKSLNWKRRSSKTQDEH